MITGKSLANQGTLTMTVTDVQQCILSRNGVNVHLRLVPQTRPTSSWPILNMRAFR